MIHVASRPLSAHSAKLVFAVACLALAAGFAWLTLRPAPAHTRVVVTETTVEILDDVRFVGPDTIATRSLRTLDAIAGTLEGNPSILLVEVQANTRPRAEAVRTYLIGRGVAPERLEIGVSDRELAAFLIMKREGESPAAGEFSQP